MVDKDLVVFAATNKKTGEKKYISNKEWSSLENREEWEKGNPVREAGKEMFFTVNGKRAVELGFADEVIQNRADLAKAINVREPMQVIKRTWSDTFVFLLNTGFATFLLIAIGLIALVVELSAPGISVGGLTSLLCFSLFFWSRFFGRNLGLAGGSIVRSGTYLHRSGILCDSWIRLCRNWWHPARAGLTRHGFITRFFP